MNIRRMTEGDLPQTLSMINDMYKELGYGPFFTPEDILPRIRSKFFICYLAEDVGGAVGFTMGKIVKNEMAGHNNTNGMMGFINELYVCPASRGTGVAKALLVEIETAFMDSGLEYMELYVKNTNGGGRRFWQRNQFCDKYYVMGKELHQ